MSNTNFVDRVTPILASWANDINDVVYEVLGDGVTAPTTKAAVRTGLDVPQTDGTGATGTWPITVSGTSAGVTGTVAIANGGTGQITAPLAFAALKQDASDSATGVVELATAAEYATGTDTTRVLTPAVARANNIVLGTAQNSTSGATLDFTGIPTWAKRVIINLAGVSTNGTTGIGIQIGDSGGIENTGYSNGTQNGSQSTTMLPITGGSGAGAAIYHGLVILTLLNPSTNTWAMTATIGRSDTAACLIAAGSKALSATLDRVRVTTTNGTDVFDAGVINIMWE